MTEYPERRSPVAYVADPAARAQTLYDLIQAAQTNLIFQMYLLAGNDELVTLKPRNGAYPWAHTLAGWLVERHRRSPDLEMAVILDTQTPDDAAYTRRGTPPLARHVLEEAGIPVLNAHLFDTRFNTARRWPKAAAFHHGAWAETPTENWVRAQRHWQTWHNVEDHRKNLVIDSGAWGVVTSHNVIDVAAEWHENMYLVGAPAAGDLWTEATDALRKALTLPQRIESATKERLEALCEAGATSVPAPLPRARPLDTLTPLGDPTAGPVPSEGLVTVLANTNIRPEIVKAIDGLGDTGRVSIASAYLSDVDLIQTLIDQPAGVHTRVLMDDCAGLPLPAFLSIIVRTFANLRCVVRARRSRNEHFEMRIHRSRNGPMMHLKTGVFLGDERVLIGGQANYTPNSFSGAWLETDLKVIHEPSIQGYLEQFDALWQTSERVLPYKGKKDGFLGIPAGLLSRAGDVFLLGVLSLLERLGFKP